MKKLLSLLVVFALLLAFAPAFAAESASGGELPFDLVPPAYVTANWLEGNDSPTTTAISYSLSPEMTDFFKRVEEAHLDGTIEELYAQYGITELSMTTQVDWALDDVNDSVSGWHYTKYWDGYTDAYGFGYDEEGRYRASSWDAVDYWIGNATDVVNDHWIIRGVSEDELNGDPETLTPGVKDQLKPEQYTYGEDGLVIDFNEHTMYFRMRFVVTTFSENVEGPSYYYSDWSNVASIGKDAEAFEPLTKEDIPAPVISGLRRTDKEFNGNPVVAFTLTVPDALAENASKVAAQGGGISIQTEARVKGDEEWILMPNTDWTIKGGEMECSLAPLANDAHPRIDEDTEIELRCRYVCSQPELDDIFSDYSQVIAFGTDAINQGGSEGEGSGADTHEEGAPEKKTCPICHFCPQPLGLCIFIWLAIMIAIVVIVIIVLKQIKKNMKK